MPNEENRSVLEYTIRPATLDDLASLVRHRYEMFREMGSIEETWREKFSDEVRDYYRQALPSGEYAGFLISPVELPDLIAAGAGFQKRFLIPSPANGTESGVIQGLQVHILNVYTEKDWRRKGLAELLLQHILGWCRENGAVSITLHASIMGRPLYEKLGFLATNEMRFKGNLADF